MIVHNPSHKHDSGFPYIRAFGELASDGKLVDMGWHDHYLCYAATNTDAIGKNIFRVMPWMRDSFEIRKHFMPGGTLTLNTDGTWW